jgi:hypothetical protein
MHVLSAELAIVCTYRGNPTLSVALRAAVHLTNSCDKDRWSIECGTERAQRAGRSASGVPLPAVPLPPSGGSPER